MNTFRFNKMVGKDQGYTLMEILMVMMIIGILTAIAFPAYRNLQDNANYTKVEATASHLVTALELYRSEENAYPQVTSSLNDVASMAAIGLGNYLRVSSAEASTIYVVDGASAAHGVNDRKFKVYLYSPDGDKYNVLYYNKDKMLINFQGSGS